MFIDTSPLTHCGRHTKAHKQTNKQTQSHDPGLVYSRRIVYLYTAVDMDQHHATLNRQSVR